MMPPLFFLAAGSLAAACAWALFNVICICADSREHARLASGWWIGPFAIAGVSLTTMVIAGVLA